MNKKHIIIIIFLFLIFAICGYFSLKVYTTNKANSFFTQIEKKKFNLSDLETGKYFDFSKQENDITKTKISEGIIFIDIDKKIKIVSNIKINGLYCSLENNKFNCGLSKNKYTNVLDIKEYDEYIVGDAITLNDGTKWHVIHDSNKYSKYVTLISDTRVDINNDGSVLTTGDHYDPDLIPYDKNGSKKYDITVEGNIGYYIEKTYKPSLIDLKDILEIRLITNKELENVEKRINFDTLTKDEIFTMFDVEEVIFDSIGWMEESPRPIYKLSQIKLTDEQYNKLMPHWLYNSLSGNYWVYFSDKKVRTAIWDGSGYTTAKPTTGYGLKPVITLTKDNIKS